VPTNKQLERLLGKLRESGGSDLHIKAGAPPRIRLNGELLALDGEDELTETVVGGMLDAILRPNIRDRFDNQRSADFAYTSGDGDRFRVNAYRQRESGAMVFRLVVGEPHNFEQLRLPDSVRRFAELPRGLVIVAGPTGSGKTTTLAAMVDHINRIRRAHIVTIEDPIEVMHHDVCSSVSQREIGVDTPDFAIAMRAALRQDPDVIMVGEMRDSETVSTALSAAETGHLVLSTLHTLDAAETVNRVVEFFPEHLHHQIRLVLAGALKGTVCQRLVRTADGRDRVPAVEVMVVNGRVQECILNPEVRTSIEEIIADGEYYGMQTFDQSLLSLYERGMIELSDTLAAATNPHDLSLQMRRKGLLAVASNGNSTR